MKKILCGLIFVFTILIFTGAWGRMPFKDGNTLYILASSGLNMRDQPSKTGKAVVLVPYGGFIKLTHTTQKSEVIDNISGNWIEADFNGKKGFLFDGYLTTLKPPVKDETLVVYADRLFEKSKFETVEKDKDGEITVQHYKNGAKLTKNYSSISSIIELVVPDISIEEGFLILRLVSGIQFEKDPYPSESKQYKQTIEGFEWDVDVNVDKDSSGDITNIGVIKGPGVSLGIKVSKDNQGNVLLSKSSVD